MTFNTSKSLINFFNNEVTRFVKSNEMVEVLDIGVGSYSVFEVIENNFKITAIDNNIEAIIQTPSSKIFYKLSAIENFESDVKYKLIFDSHALHCIIDLDNRKTALKNIYSLLDYDGYFALETMVMRDVGDLFLSFQDRLVLNYLDIENELLNLGFKIMYFKICSDLYFESPKNSNIKSDLLRVIVQK